jgi:hypothetical protein
VAGPEEPRAAVITVASLTETETLKRLLDVNGQSFEIV